MYRYIFVFIVLLLTVQSKTSAQCDPSPITPSDVSKAVVLIELRDNTTNNSRFCVGTLINNVAEDGKNLVLTSNFHFDTPLCGETYMANEYYFHWENGQTTQRANILAQNDVYVLLELVQEPPYEEITYLGLDNPEIPFSADLITYFDDGSSTFQTQLISSKNTNFLGTYDYSCDNNGNVTYNWEDIINGVNLDFNGIMIEEWENGEGNVNSFWPTLGSPLISTSDLRVQYTYLSRFEENICDRDEAIFTEVSQFAPIDLFGSIGRRSIKIKKCLPQVVVSLPISSNRSYKAETVVGESEILDVEVTFEASDWIILRPDFSSGNNFHASIGPCTNETTELSLENGIIYSRSTALNKNILISPNPSSGVFTIHSSSNISAIQVYDYEGKLINPTFQNVGNQVSISMHRYPAGIYFVQVLQDNVFSYHKIIKQ